MRTVVCPLLVIVAAVLGYALSPAQGAIFFGQVDDFQIDSTMGWEEGSSSPNPPTNVRNGGPNGVGDAYLENRSSGGAGAGSKQVMFNSRSGREIIRPRG